MIPFFPCRRLLPLPFRTAILTLTFFRIEGNSLSGRCEDKIFHAKDKEENHFFFVQQEGTQISSSRNCWTEFDGKSSSDRW